MWETAPDADSGGFPMRRYLSAFRRYLWLIALAILLGAGAGAVAYELIEPEYVAQGSLWIAVGADDRNAPARGPITQGQLLQSYSWIELLRSYTVLDPVAAEQRLYIRHDTADARIFQDFTLGDGFLSGRYRLTVSENGDTYVLQTDEGETVESGRIGEPAAREIGFEWTPPSSELQPGRQVEFTVMSTRAAAMQLNQDLTTGFEQGGTFLRLELRGGNREQLARVLDAVMERYVDVAASLKASQLVTYTDVLREQLENVEAVLRQAELDLQSFRIQTITLPSDQAGPIASGLAETQASVLQDFFTMRMQLDALERDRTRLQEAMRQIPEFGVRIAAFELIPPVQTSSALQEALSEMTIAQAEIRALRQTYTDEHEAVIELRERVRTLETETIPDAAEALLAELLAQERVLQRVIDSRAAELEEIPPRSIEEGRLERDVAIASTLYGELRQRHETAELAAASSVPDVSILDRPAVPQAPTNDERLRWSGMVFAGFLGLGMLGVVVLDRFDPRLRNPSDVPDQLGLRIMGAIPRVSRGRKIDKENIEQAREAFRELRMQLQYGYGASKPMLLAVTSPAKGEGKTFVSANLAIAFSELGLRTLLIDGDTRQGDLHELLAKKRKPGLTDLLAGREEGGMVQATEHQDLYFMGFGSRRTDSPDLLNSQRMQELLSLAKRHYEVIIFDCPPLGAGGDAFILGAHCGHVLLVLRTGATNKELALAKLEPFYRLPVRILGAVLNDVDPSSIYGRDRYYYASYLPGYRAVGEDGDRDDAIVLAGD
jgi:capsular exopolysaccharide synthesis family protein